MYTGTLLEFLNMGGGEIMLILAVVLLLFGGKKLPELARGLGKGIRDFKDASEGVKREIHRNINSMDLEKELEDDKPVDTSKDTPMSNTTEPEPKDDWETAESEAREAWETAKSETKEDDQPVDLNKSNNNL